MEKNEQFDVKQIDWKKVDVFSFGVTLFSILFLVSPFDGEHATEKDKNYKHIISKNYKSFWKCNEQVILLMQGMPKPDLLKDLVERMIAFKPEDRLTMNEVYNHAWFKER